MSAKKEKIRICNRPMRSSSPHRYSKYNQPGRKMDSKFISSALVIYKHPHSRAADENIAYNAQDIRHITEDEKSERRGEEHLRVVIDRYLLRRCADIRPRYPYLTDAGESPQTKLTRRSPRSTTYEPEQEVAAGMGFLSGRGRPPKV